MTIFDVRDLASILGLFFLNLFQTVILYISNRHFIATDQHHKLETISFMVPSSMPSASRVLRTSTHVQPLHGKEKMRPAQRTKDNYEDASPVHC